MNGLAYWLERYIASHAMKRKAAGILKRSIKLFIGWRGGDCDVAEITEHSLSDWVESLEASYSPRTLKNHRANMLAVLKLAADFEARPEPRPRLIRRVPVPPPDPQAWTAKEFAKLLTAGGLLKGKLSRRPRITRAQYLLTMVAVAFDTGARRGDIMRIEHDWLDDSGRLRFRISKTKRPHVAQLRQCTVEMVKAIDYRYPLKWTGPEEEYYDIWREACKSANVRYGATQQVRRTAATVVWRDDPGSIQRFMGHLTPDMWKHYVDQVQAATPVRPREFWKELVG